MIVAPLVIATTHGHFAPRLARGLEWLRSLSPDMPDGRVPIEGDDVFALIQSYGTAPSAEKRFESHRNYIDIQYIAAGHEVIEHAPVALLTASTLYNPDKDFLLYDLSLIHI